MAATDPLTQLRESGDGGFADTTCHYCREEKGDCRPIPIVGRQYVPALCDDCYVALSEEGRFDRPRDCRLYHSETGTEPADSVNEGDE